MGEQKRRAAAASQPSRQELNDALAAMHAEGGGLYHATIVSPFSVRAILEASAAGDREATQVGRAFAQILAGPPAGCLLCGRETSRKTLGAGIVLSPDPLTATQGIGGIVCIACCDRHDNDDAAVLRAAVAFYREHLNAGLRILDGVHPGEGRA
jgi:hypothetical protein